MPEASQQMVVAPTPAAQYVPALIVVTENGKVSVPVNAEANRLESQVIVAELRSLYKKQLKQYSELKSISPALMKELVNTGGKIEDIARFAYAPGLTPDEGGEKCGPTPAQMIKAMAEGVATAGHKAFAAKEDDRMKEIRRLGMPRNVGPVIIDAE